MSSIVLPLEEVGVTVAAYADELAIAFRGKHSKTYFILTITVR